MSFLFLLVVSMSLGFSALALTPNDILKTAWEDELYLSQINRISPSSSNPFRNIELTASRESTVDNETEVGLKLQLKSFPEWRMRNSSQESEKIIDSFTLSWALHTRYMTLMRHKLLHEKKDCYEDLHQLQKKYAEAQGIALRAGRATGKNYSKSRMDALKSERILSQIDHEIIQVQRLLAQWRANAGEGDRIKAKFISFQEMQDIVRQLDTSTQETLSYRLGYQEIVQLQREIEVVQGRESQWLKSLGVSHKNKKNESVYEFQVSIQLPFLFSDESAIQKKNELVFRRAQKRKDLSEKESLSSLRTHLLNSLSDFLSIDLPVVMKSSSPLEKTEERIQNAAYCVDKVDLQMDLLTQYLSFLLESEQLAKDPHRNYLFAEGRIQ